MIFLASRRWLALESKLLTVGDMQRLSLVKETGEVTEDVYRGLVVEREKLVWKCEGDWEREPHGGDTGDVTVDGWDGLDVETKKLEDWTFWLTNGDWHLDPQGGVDTFVLEGLDVGTEELV